MLHVTVKSEEKLFSLQHLSPCLFPPILPFTVFTRLVFNRRTFFGFFCTLPASKAVKQSVKPHILKMAAILAASKE